jgi:hypothetical protein
MLKKNLRAGCRWPTAKAESCQSVIKQIKSVVKQVGVMFFVRNIVAGKIYNTEFAVPP